MTFHSLVYYVPMAKRKVELWDQLDHETEYQYEAFRAFFSLPRKERGVLEAYRTFSGNSTANAPTPNFWKWANEYAWSERARARDAHLDRVQLRGQEKAIEDAAREEFKASQEIRGRTRELLTSSYQKALEFFENTDYTDLNARDAVQIIKMHIEASKEFAIPLESASPEDDWNEDDDRELVSSLEELRAEEAERDAAQAHAPTKEEGT